MHSDVETSARAHRAGGGGSGAVDESELILDALTAAVEAIGSVLQGSAEVVLHDLRRLPESIVAVAGNVTGRTVGDPATDVLLEAIVGGTPDDQLVSYATTLSDGRSLTSSTRIIRDSAGNAVAAFCVNADLEAPARLRELIDSVLPRQVGPASGRPVEGEDAGERFAHDVDELAAHLISDTLARSGIPVDLMRKEHKIAVVARLRARGMFLLKDSIETVAAALHVTRFTIYNYLNELDEASAPAGDDSPSD